MSMGEMLDLGLLDDVTQFNTILTPARGWILVIGDVICLTNVGRCSNVKKKYIETREEVRNYYEPIPQLNEFDMRTYPTKSETTYRQSPRKQGQDPITLEPAKQFVNYYTPVSNNGNRPMPLMPDRSIPLREERYVITTQKLASKRELYLEETVPPTNNNSISHTLMRCLCCFATS